MSLPLPSDNAFFSSLRTAIDRNFPELSPCDEELDHPDALVEFHDRHIGPHLVLKRIVVAPGLHERLADNALYHLQKFINNGHHFDASHYVRRSVDGIDFPTKDGISIARAYHHLFGDEVVQLACKMVLTPQVSEWVELLQMELHEGIHFASEASVRMRVTNGVFEVGSDSMDQVPKHTRDDVADLQRVFGKLIGLSFYSPTDRGQKVIASMDSATTFPWELPHTVGISDGPEMLRIPPDASEGFAFDEIRRNADAFSSNDSTDLSAPSTGPRQFTVKIPFVKSSPAPTFRDCVQKAWCDAIDADLTYMVFNCGSHERIGIRHRGSQTLILSDLLHPAHVNPFYGRIHLGLHIASLLDAFSCKDKRRAYDKLVSATPDAVKSSQDGLVIQMANRSDRPPPTLVNSEITYAVSDIEEQIGERDVLLISLKYGVYNSTRPSSFRRVDTSCVRGVFDEGFLPSQPSTSETYDASQCIEAALGAPIGPSGMCTLHRAVVKILDASGKSLTQTFLVKLALTPNSRQALTHEFGVYKHCAMHDIVSGILRVHGLFQDTQTDALLMLMEYGWCSLQELSCERDASSVGGLNNTLNRNEWNVIKEAVENIHSAGVCHANIHKENVAVNSANEFAIINFNFAIFTDSVFARSEDKRMLLREIPIAE